MVLSAAGLAYSTLWAQRTLRVYDVLSDRLGLADDALAGRVVELGFDIEYRAQAHGVLVNEVRRGTPAAAAGFRAGDVIVAANGRAVRDSAAALGEVYLSARPGDTVALDVVRDGGPPSRCSATFRERRGPTSLPALVRLLVGSTVLFPFVLLGVALPVLFYRLDDRNAWLLAILFLCLTAAPGFPNGFAGLDGPWRAFAMAWRSLLGGLVGAAFYWLFALFPVRSPVDRRAPWLKWALLAIGVARGLSGLGSGEPALPAALAASIGPEAVGGVGLVLGYAALALGFAALLGNAWRPTTPDARRKIHVVAWGAAVGILPAVALAVVQDLGWRMPEWVGGLALLLLFAFPLSFAYAVVRHRVLELPVLLKRSARYVLVRRGFGVLLVVLALAANALFALSFTRLFRVDATFATSAGVGFGLALASVAAPGVRRATECIDRAFFRGAYDVRRRAPGARRPPAHGRRAARRSGACSRSRCRRRCGRRSSRLIAEARDGTFARERGGGGPGPDALPADATGLLALAESAARASSCQTPASRSFRSLARSRPSTWYRSSPAGSCRVGVAVLGPRLSEEPYSGEDARLLASVAAQAGVAVDNLTLAERVAERLEAERRVAHEIELARQVQSQLLPRRGPRLASLEYAARCVQARVVGGDLLRLSRHRARPRGDSRSVTSPARASLRPSDGQPAGEPAQPRTAGGALAGATGVGKQAAASR